MEYKFKTLLCWDTELCADSVEWCPVDTFEHVFVCGTYQLQERENELTNELQHSPLRLGRLYLMELVQSEQVTVRLQATLEVSAVLDCKWAPQLILDKILLAVANAIGQVVIFELINDESTATLKLEQVTLADIPKQEADLENLLNLSLNWSIGQENIKIATSDSKGRISIYQLDGTNLHLLHNWTAHSFEAWVVHFNPFHSQICYTGGDDCKLRTYDLRCELTSAKTTNSTHSSGVTSLACPLKTENLLLSGSYDEQVLLWDSRQMKRPLNKVSVGGGVWRIRFKPHSEDLILLACMYKGFCLLDRNLHILSEYTEEHQSIGYGADWSYLSSASNFCDFPNLPGKHLALTATCSFYDHKLCVCMICN